MPAQPTVTDVRTWADEPAATGQRLARRYTRSEPRRRAVESLRGLLSDAGRKNGWQLAEKAGDEAPYGVQHPLGHADRVRDDLIAYAHGHLADPHGVLVVDETGFLKEGTKSAGVQRQYSGTAGRIENCQVGAFLAFAGRKGHALFDRELDLPEEWAGDAGRREAARIPPEVEYVLAVKSDQRLYDGRWRDRVDAIADRLPARAWRKASAGAGSQGPRWYDWAAESFGQADARGWRLWLLVRRHRQRRDERAYYPCRGPADTPWTELVRVAGSGWAVEECFERAKGDCGLADYEVRGWVGRHRHVTLSMFALTMLAVIRSRPSPREQGARA